MKGDYERTQTPRASIELDNNKSKVSNMVADKSMEIFIVEVIFMKIHKTIHKKPLLNQKFALIKSFDTS